LASAPELLTNQLSLAANKIISEVANAWILQTLAFLTSLHRRGRLTILWHDLATVHPCEPHITTADVRHVIMRAESRFAKGTLRLAVSLVFGLGTVAAPRVSAQTFTVIHNFTGGSDGANPLSGFVNVAEDLYGTASSGGSSGAGVVFRINTSGEVTVLHEFAGGTDGANPEGRLVMDKAGNFYGTTYAGGVSNAGTVFEVTSTGTETVLSSFTGGLDGANPVAGLAIDTPGNLYGTTTAGGSSGNGTVFRLAVPTVTGGKWTEKVLYSFGTGTDGAIPVAGVTFDAGKLYGTTSAGGVYGYGTIFQLTTSTPSWKEIILHHFELGSDGGVPYAGLILYDKNLYGAATEGGGGGSNGGGTVFELEPTTGGWTFTVLYGLSGWDISGTFRNLLVKSASKIYATTHCDGYENSGTVYELTKSEGTWTYNQLYAFTGGSDGQFSFSNLVSDELGNLYGTMKQAGGNGYGVAFRLTP
jgi:uncharacterized repeat protein (TIGR03803 family)